MSTRERLASLGFCKKSMLLTLPYGWLQEAMNIGEYLCRPCGGHYSPAKEVEAVSAGEPFLVVSREFLGLILYSFRTCSVRILYLFCTHPVLIL